MLHPLSGWAADEDGGGLLSAVDLCRGVAKLVKAPDFDSGMRRFESFFPCQVAHHFFPRTGRAFFQTAGTLMQANHPDFMVFTGNANPGMAVEIAQHLGPCLGAADVGRFSDGEVTVEIKQNVRGRDVFVVQSAWGTTNESGMKLLIMVDAPKRESAGLISALYPFYGYARQDRRPRS